MDTISSKDKSEGNLSFLGKKTKINEKKIIKKNSKKLTKILTNETLFESSTEQSFDNQINLLEGPSTLLKIPSLDEVKIPSFLNDITKYDKINKKIKSYYKTKKELNSPEMAKLYLIDIKRLYEERKKI